MASNIEDEVEIDNFSSKVANLPPNQESLLTGETANINYYIIQSNSSDTRPSPPPIGLDLLQHSLAAEEEVIQNDDNANNNNDFNKLTEDLIYIQPEQTPYSKAVNYLEKHHIMQIFQHLTSGIVYEKPEDPLQYMVDELGRMKVKKQNGETFPGS